MPSALSKVLHRPPGRGWIVLGGGALPDEQILRALALVGQAGSVLAIVPAARYLPFAEMQLGVWIDLSGWQGKSVIAEDSDTLGELVSESSLILLPDGCAAGEYAGVMAPTDAGDFLLEALDAGALIVAEGKAAEVLGEIYREEGDSSGERTCPGLGWIPSAIVQTHFQNEPIADLLAKRKQCFRIGIPLGTALAMGPAEEREIWGEGLPTITFGSGWKK